MNLNATKTIWKFPLNITDEQIVVMPKGSDLLSVQVQYGTPNLWALINNPCAPNESRRIFTLGTGHPAPNDLGTYLGTYQTNGSALVLHVFDSLEKEKERSAA